MTKLPVDLILTKAYTADSDLNKFKIFLLENIHRGVCNLSVDDLYDSYIHEYIFADTDEKKLRETWIVGLGWSDIFSDKKIVKEPIQNKNDFKKLIQKHIDLFRLRIALWSWIEVIMRLNPKK